MKNFILLVIVAIVAGAAGYSLRSSETPRPDPDGIRFRTLQKHFEQMSQVDFEEYLRLKDQKARFEKADEILSKILLLMLYDLGVRGSETQLARMKNPVGGASASADLSGPHTGETAETRSSVTRSHPPAGPDKSARPKNSERVKEIDRADQVEEFLKSAEIPDFFGALRTGTALNDSQLEQLNGTFIGRAVFEDPKLVPWDVQIYLNAHRQDAEIFGEFDVRLRRNGKQFSRTKSGRKRGQKSAIKTDNFMALDGDGESLILNAYGDDGYFQLYFFPRLNEFHGLVYLKKSLGVFERKGVVHLTKN